MKTSLKYFLVLLLSGVLVACSSGGGGGGDDDPDPAKISANNERELGVAASSGAMEALENSDAPTSLLRPSDDKAAILSLSASIANISSEKIALQIEDLSDIICTGTNGGSVIADTNNDATEIEFDFDNCDTGTGIFDGEVEFESSTSGNTTTTTLDYDDFTVTIGTEVTNFDLSVTCTTNNSTLVTTCSYSSTLDGIDGRTYTVSGASVSGNSSSGYTISATITDPDYGTISITTPSPILFNCPDGLPSTGQIQFTDVDGVVVSITFNDCNTFTVSYSGNSTVYNWADII